MELRHLRIFLAVADELHFTRAAARLGVAQPHVSQEIQRLERELGVVLFQRTRRQVSLTPGGEALRAAALRVLAAVDDAAEEARRAARGETGSLTVGFAGSAGYDLLPAAIRHFRSRWPDVTLRLLEMTTEAQVRDLERRRIDVGVGRPHSDPGPGLVSELLRTERSLAALPDQHPLAGRTSLTLEELREESWIVFGRNVTHGLYAHFMAACADAGFTPKIAQEVGEIPTLINLVAAGVGVALVPLPVARLQRDDVVYRELGPGAPAVSLAVIMRRNDTTPTVANFLAALREAGA